jgi:hypothetical protein
MGCAFGQGQLNQSEGESEWGGHWDRSRKTKQTESEWSDDSDRG